MEKNDKSINIFGLPLFSKGMHQLLEHLSHQMSDSRSTAYIFCPNPEQLVLAWQKPDFAKVLAQGTWLIPDGVGLVWASHLLKSSSSDLTLSASIPGRAVVAELITLAKRQDCPVLIIGGREYQGRQVLGEPIKEIIGTQHAANTGFSLWWTPAFANIADPTVAEELALKKVIEKLQPTVVLVALGAPYQEQWSLAHHQMFKSNNTRIVMAIGGSIDVLSGKLQLPPAWMSQVGLEWFFRLIQQPWRLKRQLRLVTFGWLVLKEKLNPGSVTLRLE